MPAAEEFLAWVTEEVLPSIRKTGPALLGISQNKLMPVLVSAPDQLEPRPQNKMNTLLHKVFDFKGHPLTTVTNDNDGAPWFVAKELMAFLDIKKSRNAISSLDDIEKATVVIADSGNGGVPSWGTQIPGWRSQTTVITSKK